MTRAESNIVLFSITLCWASSYIFIKNLPPGLSSFAYMTMTSGLAGIILAIVFFKRLRELKGKLLLRSGAMAVVICANMIFERLGIAGLSASMASFTASLSIVFVPLFMLLLKRKPTKNNLLGIVVILFGLVLTSGVYAGNALEAGAIYMVIACIFMALYIIIVDRFTKQFEPLLLGIGQMFFTALIAFGLWCLEEPQTFFALTYTREMLANIFLLAFFARAYAYIMLMYSQKYANPISVTVIASTEPVVTMVLALLIPGTYGVAESFALPKFIGAGFIVAGAICAGTDFLGKPDLLQKIKALWSPGKGAASHE
jgi:drug/metabolite transporter (DMT)-like permease